MKRIYDRGHQERTFQPGDYAYVRLQTDKYEVGCQVLWPFQSARPDWGGGIQVGITHWFEGSPSLSRVSTFKQKLGPATATSTVLPECESEHPVLPPQAALGFHGHINNREVLIHWRGFSPADATWETVLDFQARFPDFLLEDKDTLNGGGML